MPLSPVRSGSSAVKIWYDGDVLIRNESHLDPANHKYRVTVVDGIPESCECPADERFDGPCKHRTAIAIRPTILDVATQMQLVDGGRSR
jgi:hypothetical protein